jgi:integrase
MSVHKLKGLKSTSYQARWTDPSGIRKSKNFKTKSTAEKFEAEMMTSVLRSEYSDPQSAKMRVEEIYPLWIASSAGLKPKTLASYKSLWRTTVGPVWAKRRLGSINPAEIKTWLNNMESIGEREIGVSRKIQSLAVLSGILNHAIDLNLINRNPAKSGAKGSLRKTLQVKVEKKPKRSLETQELLSLANTCGNYRLLILVAGLLGLRWAELVALTPEDFDFKKNQISITKSMSEESGRFYLVTPKSGKPRIVPIPEFISKDLKALVLSTSKGSPIFTSPEGGYLRHGNFRKRVFLPAVEKADLKKFTFHELRDTAISQAISTGANILVISAIAGHANTSITLNVYGHQINDTMNHFKHAIDNLYIENESDKSVTNEGVQSA